MPANEWIKDTNLDASGRFKYTYTADQANSSKNWMVLQTKDTFVDKDIFVQAIVNAGQLSAGSTTVSANAVNAGSLLTLVSTAPTNDPYITVTGQGTVGVSTAGWIDTTATQTSTSNTLIYKITQGAYTVEDVSGDRANGAVTPKIILETIATKSVSSGGLGFTLTQPTGTSGVDYITIDPSADVASNWSVTPHATITTGGYIAAGDKSGTVITAAPTINNGSNYYVPIVDVTVSGGTLNATGFSKDDLAVSFDAGRTTSTYRNITASSVRVGTKSTTTYPYFFEIKGTTPAVSGTTSVSRDAITYSNNAGAIPQHVSTQAITGDSVSPTVNVNAATDYTFFSMKKSAATVTATVAKPTIQKINLSSGGVSGKTQVLATTDLIKQSSYSTGIDKYYIAVQGSSGAVTQNSVSITTEGYLKETNSITLTSVAAGNQTDIYYLPLPTATFSASEGAVTVATAGYVAPGDTVVSITTGSITAVTTDPGNSYPEITSNVTVASGGYLKIEGGYFGNGKISLATIVPDEATAGLAATYILDGYKAYDRDGVLVTGSILTYQGAYSVT